MDLKTDPANTFKANAISTDVSQDPNVYRKREPHDVNFEPDNKSHIDRDVKNNLISKENGDLHNFQRNNNETGAKKQDNKVLSKSFAQSKQGDGQIVVKAVNNCKRKISKTSTGGSTCVYEIPLDSPKGARKFVKTLESESLVQPTVGLRQKIRFLICILGVLSVSICMAARMALNIAINDINGHHDQKHGYHLQEHIEHVSHDVSNMSNVVEKSTFNQNSSISERHYYGHNESGTHQMRNEAARAKASGGRSRSEDGHIDGHGNIDANSESKTEQNEWDAEFKQNILGAFYIGYLPVMLVSGYLTDRYGAKIPLAIAGLGSGIINLITPYASAEFSKPLFYLMRVLLGSFQAPLVPAIYGLCNRWLTETEIGIFASIIKVSIGLGVLLGYLIPGSLMKLQYEWPSYFYVEGSACLLWSIAWIIFSTSRPIDSKWVTSEELSWINRKKPINLKAISRLDHKANKDLNENVRPNKSTSIIKQILLHPSVWALAITKFTHNLALDFILIELTTYMLKAQGKTLPETITIACIGSMTMVVLVTFIGWLAKIVVQRKVYNLSKTVWRKIFQAISNTGSAFLFFLLASADIEKLESIALIVVFLFVFFMFGAGGEAVAANDISINYPATIYGFAHSISTLSGLAIPSLAASFLGDEPTNRDRWSDYFYTLSFMSLMGGFVFIMLFKSKLFLEQEVVSMTSKTTKRSMTNIESDTKHKSVPEADNHPGQCA